MPRGPLVVAVFVALLAAGAYGLWRFSDRRAGTKAPGERAEFAGSAACASCHPKESQAWMGSHHQLAMQMPAPGVVHGNFGGASFTSPGGVARFSTRDSRYFVTADTAAGKPATLEVRYVIGVKPVQQYVLELPGGRLQCFTVAWDTEKRRWYSLYPDQRIALDDPLHWTGRYQNWNLMCADCHTTGFRKGYDPRTDSYTSAWTEFDVGCEACHGPGKAHAARPTRPPGGALKSSTARAQTDVCAPCHSRRHRIGPEAGDGGPFLDEFMPELVRDPLYFADGQIHDEVYEYGSYLQSKMYARGVRCSDCHDPHSAKLVAQGNALCTRCHQVRADRNFPTLAAREYDAPSHHHHRPGSEGARCVSCHMPQRDYMVIHARRDHFLRPPRPDLTVALGTPNACNGCHANRSAAWAAENVNRWFGAHPRDTLFARAVAAGRSDARGAPALLARTALDSTRSAITRATALDLLRVYPAAASPVAASAARDSDALVRAAAAEAMETLPIPERVSLGVPFLDDTVRAVRVAAARILASVPQTMLTTDQRARLEAATAEYEAGLAAMADMPSTHLNLAVLQEGKGRDDLAEASYRTALRMDPYFLPARMNLATLYNRAGRNADAERELREGIRRQPDQGELHYSLGLILAEEGRLEEAARALDQAAEMLPARARVHYNLALASSRLGRSREAEQELRIAMRIDPLDPDILYAAAWHYAERGEWARALPLARKLATIRPGDESSRALLARIEARAGAAAP